MPDTTTATAALSAAWADKAPASQALYDRAQTVIPSGINHDGRKRLSFPPYFRSAQGAYKEDVDGNRYLDLWMGHGSLLLGHSYPPVVEAIQKQAAIATHLGGAHAAEVEWAEQIKMMVPSIDRIRFVNSGTEAALLATRLARAATGRPGIIKLAGHFHGWHDSMTAGQTDPYHSPLGGGLTQGVCQDILVCPPNNISELRQIIESTNAIAALILEPTGAHGGQSPFMPGYLQAVRSLTAENKVLLIFDEVVTGFRLAPGGAQEKLNLQADLVTYAKVLAGGLPGGAVGGKESVMSYLNFSDNASRNRYSKVHHFGTYNANPCSAQAGIAALKAVQSGEPNQKAADASKLFVSKGNAVFEKFDLPWRFYGDDSIIHFTCNLNAGEAAACEKLRWRKHGEKILFTPPPVRQLFDLALLICGVDLPPGGQAWLSCEHDEAAADFFVAAIEKALTLLRETGAIE